MKIALFVGQFPKVSETFILNQIDGLLDCGHEITIFPLERSAERKVHDIVSQRQLMACVKFPPEIRRQSAFDKFVYRASIFFYSAKYWSIVRRLKAAFDEYRFLGTWRLALVNAEPVLSCKENFDLAFAHFGPNGLRANWYRQAGLINGPVVTVFHGFDLSTALTSHNEQIYKALFATGDLFLPISNHWREKLISLGCPEEITSIHHVGIDCEQFSFQSRSRKNGESTIFISVARLVEKKGLEYAIKAFSRLRFSSQENFNFQYRIIGDGPLLESLQQLVTDENLGEYVLFLGSKTSEEVAFELGCAHIFLAPSVTASDGDMEGIPTVLMEAMATGLPVISTYHSGIPELVEDGVSGVLVKERDIPGLATAIEHLSTDIENWSRMGEAGREKVLCDFNIEKLNVRLDRLFRLLLEKYRQ